jgi:hypothetical protein
LVESAVVSPPYFGGYAFDWKRAAYYTPVGFARAVDRAATRALKPEEGTAMCVYDSSSGLYLPELNSLAGFKVVERAAGVHRGRGGFSYPIQALRIDPAAVAGHHERCMHFVFSPETAERNLLGDYGSHVLFCALLPGHRWSRAATSGRCLHGDLTVPLGCLTCGEGGVEVEVLDLPRALPSGMTRSRGGDPLGWVRNLPVVSG